VTVTIPPPPSIRSLNDRRILITGAAPTAISIADALTAAGAKVVRMAEGFASEAAVHEAVSAAEDTLGGLDQVVHAWVPASLLASAEFTGISETSWQEGCEAALSGAWWLAREAIPPLLRTRGNLTFLIPTIGMSGAAHFTMLATVAEGIRVLAKGCGRQLGAEVVTVNSIATAAHLWLPPDDAAAVTSSTSLSTPAFGRTGDAADDIAPIIALLGQPEAHFVTAGTVVADGGVWMGL
jgi:NAD(P)-dependent dehydrogenase (short-subunit alcohol dehydrogenase family)